MKHLKEVLRVLQENQLVINRKKCMIARDKLEYLGHVISKKGVEIDPKKISATVEWHEPKDLKALRGFLVLAGYY